MFLVKLCYALFCVPYMSSKSNFWGGLCVTGVFLQLELEHYLSPLFNFLICCRLFHNYKSDTDSLVNHLNQLI